MGELRTRKRGKTWEYSFEGAKIGGKRKPISKGGFRTKADAVSAGTQAKAEYDNTGRTFKPSEISVSDYMDYWIENYVKINLKYNTQSNYECLISNHIKPVLGVYRLISLEPDVIQKWIDTLKIKGYSRSMVKNTLTCLSGALSYAVYPCRYISFNPCDYVRIPKISIDRKAKEHTEYICEKADYATILDRFPLNSSFFLPIVTGYNCGTRLGESYGIDLMEDVDFENHVLTIQHQLSNEKKQWYYRSPKYDSVRTIKMIPDYELILRDEIDRRIERMKHFGPYYTKTYVMPDGMIMQAPSSVPIVGKEIMPISVRENGELLTPNSFKYCARVIHEELGNPFFHSHCLRHTHGTILAENGAQPKTVMERLGHKDIKTTMNRYIFNTEKMQNDAVDIFVKAHK